MNAPIFIAVFTKRINILEYLKNEVKKLKLLFFKLTLIHLKSERRIGFL